MTAPWTPTADDLEDISIMYGRGMTIDQIANYYGIHRDTIYARRKDLPELELALKQGKGKAHAYVTGKLFALIEAGNLSATIFYMKTQMGWKEAQTIEHTGKDGESIKIDSQYQQTAHDKFTDIVNNALKDDNDNG